MILRAYRKHEFGRNLASPPILRRSEEAANIKKENPNRAKVVYGSTWTGFFPSSSYLTIRLRESAGLEPATSAVQRQRPRHALSGKQLLECGENLAPTERWGDRTQNCLHDVRIVGNTELIWDG